MARASTLFKSLLQRHSAFEAEIVDSEYNRTRLMIGALALLLVAALVNVWILEESVFSFYGGYQGFFAALVWAAVMLAFEGAVLWRIAWFRRGELKLPSLFRYAYSFVEVTFPSILIAYQVFVLHQSHFLESPLFLFYLFIIFLSALHIDALLSFIIGLTAAIEYAIIVWVMSGARTDMIALEFPVVVYYVRCLMIIITGGLAYFIADQFRRRIVSFLTAARRQGDVEARFGQQVSAEVARAVEEQGDEAREFNATVLVVDIRNFSSFAEQHTPAQILEYQNRIFGPMIAIITSHHGIVNQILGDGLMAIFGAPVPSGKHGQEAFSAATQILESVKALNRASAIPETRIGIGLHTGEVITGNIGTRDRKQYSFSGSAVIVAFRVEQLNKELGTELLITEPVRQDIDPRISLIYLGKRSLKGLHKTIDVYQASENKNEPI